MAGPLNQAHFLLSSQMPSTGPNFSVPTGSLTISRRLTAQSPNPDPYPYPWPVRYIISGLYCKPSSSSSWRFMDLVSAWMWVIISFTVNVYFKVVIFVWKKLTFFLNFHFTVLEISNSDWVFESYERNEWKMLEFVNYFLYCCLHSYISSWGDMDLFWSLFF